MHILSGGPGGVGHGHVLVEIARNPDVRVRAISPVVGLTERTVQAIVTDLDATSYLTRTRIGRRTRYTVNPDSPFRHRAQDGLRVGPLLDLHRGVAAVDRACAGRGPRCPADQREGPAAAAVLPGGPGPHAAVEHARLLARLETMPVIDQAKGIIMAQSHCGDAQAFSLLRRASQRSNVPVRELAAQIVAKTAQVPPRPVKHPLD